MTASTGSGPAFSPGDLGRRVAHRREELGWSREQLAQRAGMAPGYVAYVEEQAARVTTESLARLALALNTTVNELLGGSVELPSGQGRPAAEPRLEELSAGECERHLAAGGVGRIVFVADRGPVALPVNFRMLGKDLVFRTAEGAGPTALSDTEPVSFEVDHVDDAMSEGWSVLVTGRLRRVSADEFRQLEKLGVEPWAGGHRSVFLLLEPRQVSGRRIRTGD